MDPTKPIRKSRWRRWFSAHNWNERVVTCDPSWFTVNMGTGILVQLLYFFPWPARWLNNLGYCFWILDIILFVFFLLMSIARVILYPDLARGVLRDFNQTSYLGALAVGYDTVVAGLLIHYSDRESARYATEVLYWIAVVLTTLVTLGGVFALYTNQGHHQLGEVTGVWLLLPIPMIVTAALGSNLTPYLEGNNAATVLIVSFFMWSLGIGVSFMIITIYLWRLMACSLPPRDAIVSCFVPIGPPGMGAFAIVGLATDLAAFISHRDFDFQNSDYPPVSTSSQAAVAQAIEWFGVLVGLALLGIASFFLIEALASCISKVPRSFSIGFWSFVFPLGVYSNAFCRLSTQLRNDGMKGWAATWVVVTVLLWLMCATMTLYKGIWQGKLFVAPGLQDYLDDLNRKTKKRRDVSSDGTYAAEDMSLSESDDRYQV